jgi:hypothetical protein
MAVGQVFSARLTGRWPRVGPVGTASVPPRAGVTSGRARRRAALSIVTGVALFLGSQLATGYAIDTERSPLRDPIFYDKLDLFRTHPTFFPGGPDPPTSKPVTVLFIGSSRTMNAVDAGSIGPRLTAALGRPVEAFNFGQAGAGPITNAVYARRLMRAGAKADFALIEVHPVFLAGQRPDSPETRWLLPFRLRPEELPLVRRMGFAAETPPSHGVRGWLAPWYEYRFLVVDRYAPYFLMHNSRLNGGHTPDRHGFTRLQDSVPAHRKEEFLNIAHGQYVEYFGGYRPTGPGVAAIRDTLEQCRAVGWRAALVLMPESETWRGWYDPEGLRQLDTTVSRLATDYGVPVFDTRTWIPDELTIDGHHLSGVGADVLTERLARESLAPWLTSSLGRGPGRAP